VKRHLRPAVLVLALALGLAMPAAATSTAINLQVDSIGFFSTSTGMAIVSGRVTCEAGGKFGTADISVRQKVGQDVIEDYATIEVVCDDTPHRWTATVLGNMVDKRGDGLYHGGPASVGIYVFADGDEAFVRQPVKLRGTR
jgi:hypothetical protein